MVNVTPKLFYQLNLKLNYSFLIVLFDGVNYQISSSQAEMTAVINFV